MTVTITRWTPGPSPWQLLADPAATTGQFLVGEARLEPGMPAPGLHVHEREHESLYIIEGVMTVELGDERFELHEGDFTVLPPRITHRFGNLGDTTVRAIGVIAPTGLEGMFKEQEAYFSQLSGEPDPARLAEIAQPYGVTILGPPLTR